MAKQEGSLLIELALVLMLMLALSTGAATWLKYRAEQQKTENLAHWMLGVQQGVQRYLDTYATHLLQQDSSTAISGFVDEWHPTVAELVAAQFLAADFVYNSQISIYVQPAGCAIDTCHLDALVVYEVPLITPKGHIDLEATAHWLAHTQGKGYVVYEHRPQWLAGASRRLLNPLAGQTQALAVGTVALLASTDNADALFLKLKDRRNPHFQTDVDSAGSLRAAQDVQAGRYLYLPSLEQAQQSCTQEGAISREQNRLLLCEEGVWILLSSQSIYDPAQIKLFFEEVLNLGPSFLPLAQGGYYGKSKDTVRTMACWLSNPLTQACSCPAGFTNVVSVGSKRLRTYYSNASYSDTRMLELYGCMAS